MAQERKYFIGGLAREQGKNILKFIPKDGTPNLFIEITDDQVIILMKNFIDYAWQYFDLTLRRD